VTLCDEEGVADVVATLDGMAMALWWSGAAWRWCSVGEREKEGNTRPVLFL
jgi:hypothetical protein